METQKIKSKRQMANLLLSGVDLMYIPSDGMYRRCDVSHNDGEILRSIIWSQYGKKEMMKKIEEMMKNGN